MTTYKTYEQLTETEKQRLYQQVCHVASMMSVDVSNPKRWDAMKALALPDPEYLVKEKYAECGETYWCNGAWVVRDDRYHPTTTHKTLVRVPTPLKVTLKATELTDDYIGKYAVLSGCHTGEGVIGRQTDKVMPATDSGYWIQREQDQGHTYIFKENLVTVLDRPGKSR